MLVKLKEEYSVFPTPYIRECVLIPWLNTMY